MKYFAIVISALVLSLSLHGQSQDVVNQPIKNFEVLWSTFNDRYANFDLKKVDWDAVYKRYRPRVTATTTNLELFEISCAMVQELSDGHVGIEPNFDNSDVDCGAPYLCVFDELIQSQEDLNLFEDALGGALTSRRFRKAQRIKVTPETNFQYRTSDKYGYLRVDEMTEQLNLKPLDRALDQAMSAFRDKEGVIIDLRLNGGGWDVAGYKIANRFVNKKRLGHLKKKRIKGSNKFSKLKSVYLEPAGDYQFTKPVVILVSDYTASAAEVFLLALKDLPYVTMVGDTTEGIFSDMYEFKLPNGWEVSLSDMQFFDANRKNYEGRGIEPDYKVVNSRAEMDQRKDGVLEKAVEVLEVLVKK